MCTILLAHRHGQAGVAVDVQQALQDDTVLDGEGVVDDAVDARIDDDQHVAEFFYFTMHLKGNPLLHQTPIWSIGKGGVILGETRPEWRPGDGKCRSEVSFGGLFEFSILN